MAFAIVLFFLIGSEEKVSQTRQLCQEKYYKLVKELGLGDGEYFFLGKLANIL